MKIILSAALLLLPSTAIAGHCGYGHGFAPRYYAPPVHVCPPVVEYQPVPVAVFNQYPNVQLFSVSPYLQQQTINSLPQGVLPGQVPQGFPSGQVPQQFPGQQLGQQPQQQPGDVGTVNPDPGQIVFQNRCAGCHHPDARQVAEKGAPIMFSRERQAIQLSARLKGSIEEVLEADIMPPPEDGYQPLPRDEKAAIVAWLNRTQVSVQLPPAPVRQQPTRQTPRTEPIPAQLPPVPPQETRLERFPDTVPGGSSVRESAIKTYTVQVSRPETVSIIKPSGLFPRRE